MLPQGGIELQKFYQVHKTIQNRLMFGLLDVFQVKLILKGELVNKKAIFPGTSTLN